MASPLSNPTAKRSLAALILAATITVASPVEAQPTSTPAIKAVRVRDLLRQAIDHYQRSEFGKAKTLLDKLLRFVGDDRGREAQEVHTYLAFVHVAFGKSEEAVASFQRALAIQPKLTLKAPSPKIAAAFEQAKRRYGEKIRALDHDPPRLRHKLVAKAKYGAPLSLIAHASDASSIKSVTLNYRIIGNRGYSSVKMESQRGGSFVGSIPSMTVMRPGVEYYIEAWDELGNGPGLKGSLRAPIRVKVLGGPLRSAPTPAVAKAWYKKWWVWATVATVVAAAGGVSAGLYFGRSETARATFNRNRDFDPPGGK